MQALHAHLSFVTEIDGSDEMEGGGSDEQIWQDDFWDERGGFKNVHLEHDQEDMVVV